MKLNEPDIVIKRMEATADFPMELLLLADPSEEMIQSYIYRSRIYAALKEKETIGICVVSMEEENVWEIRNLAVASHFQGQGLGQQLLQHVIAEAKLNKVAKLMIGTANASVGQLYLYQKVGFEITAIRKNFFLDHYDMPIVENGIPCKHMIMLEMVLG
ncbi:aminoglycoside 6'-N-acetyltransferase I [Chitinophaga dinghuensis]|uniref:Aminoglycoside 6'-N-acetyltransferase I n=1 Tax=Chitinophaga dinghuensis TaxID=1539050 RepID=A0A327VY85_9BACT|nr:GNAT family N-acetyltransferase [Chitinophaga dinghuensis]RAJ80313.1 aminoglycoside 6'-N-acetyltransferase I [Chitinophaga dinghuensis]